MGIKANKNTQITRFHVKSLLVLTFNKGRLATEGQIENVMNAIKLFLRGCWHHED